MFSYRHSFHAGNHADVLKHIVLIELIDYMLKKEKGFTYIDTHAGAGWYSIVNKNLTLERTDEAQRGINLLLETSSNIQNQSINKFLEFVKNCRKNKEPFYPGSPFIASQRLRVQDQIKLFEWHPSEIQILKNNFFKKEKIGECKIIPNHTKIVINHQNGFKCLKSILPPAQKRSLVLIDPSYEDKTDYKNLEICLADALHRFPTGVFAIWYPLVARQAALELPQKLAILCKSSWLHTAFHIKKPPIGWAIPKAVKQTSLDSTTSEKIHNFKKKSKDIESSFYGSGLFIINPPYTLAKSLQEILPCLVNAIGKDKQAGFIIEKSIN